MGNPLVNPGLLPLTYGILPTERLFRTIRGAQPAAGAEVSIQVPGGELWLVHGVRMEFVASAVVATRRVNLTFDDGNDEWLRTVSGSSLTAGLTGELSWFPQAAVAGFTGADSAIIAPIPEVPLLGGSRIRTVTTNIDVGDQFGVPVVYVQAFQVRGLERAADLYARAVADAIGG